MNAMLNNLSAATLADWEQVLGDWFYILSAGFLVFEIGRYLLRKQLTWVLAGDALANVLTQVLYTVVSALLFFAFYLSALAYFHQFAVFEISVTWVAVGLAVVAADLAYYWEHRFSHRVAIAWATHTVHHSSPHFNISVAYRFGPMDAFWPVFFAIPLVVIGFDPFLVIFAELFVLLFQTFLHTEAIGKLPRPIEAVFNTPSHHRVHHGANEQYIDKNYAGIFILWDRLFGTFAEEVEPVVFGITEPVNTVNPLKIFFHGFARLARKVSAVPGFRNKLATLLRPPGWQPRASVHAIEGQMSS